MKLRTLLIPLAAFAITVTGASAFNSDALKNLGVDLTDAQVSALEEAHTIREEAHEQAQAVLTAAGLDTEKMREVRHAMRELHHKNREAMKAALEANDYQAFLNAIQDTPMADEDISEEDFKKLIEAHELMEQGDRDGAKAIFDELGLKGPGGFGKGGHHGGGFGPKDGE